jgi:hypothetical protein
MSTTTQALMGALDRATALATAALALVSCRPPETRYAVLGDAIKEQLLALRADAEVIRRVWDEGRDAGRAEMGAEVRAAFAAGRAFEAELASAPTIPMLALAAGAEGHASPGRTRPDIRLVRPSARPPR